MHSGDAYAVPRWHAEVDVYRERVLGAGVAWELLDLGLAVGMGLVAIDWE